MSWIFKNYYKGFEGEPEIQFIHISQKERKILRIWEGYFDEIMGTIKPDVKGWTSLAYYYHLHEGWYDNENWVIPDLESAIQQFQTINTKLLDVKTKSVLNDIIKLLNIANYKNDKVLISYD